MQSFMDSSDKPMFMSASWTSLNRPRWAPLIFLFSVIAILSLQLTSKSPAPPPGFSRRIYPAINTPPLADGSKRSCAGFFHGPADRKVVMSIAEFGGVGDGRTSNTEAFRKAVRFMDGLSAGRGSQLNVPKGRWLTGSFNLTSNFTLFLEEGAVILGSQDPEDWPIVQPLPSYGRGRESNVVIKDMTILAPLTAPNTDGIDPEDLHVWDSAAGVRIKTDVGRGGYISNISIKNILMERVKVPIRFSRGSNDHPDEGWDPKALPAVKGIFIRDIYSVNSTRAPMLDGMVGAVFEGICMRNVTMLGLHPNLRWHYVPATEIEYLQAKTRELRAAIGATS
ncbi:hypothetical protein SAY87_017109 [Trapa incisa]|uniref:Polygalacturonase n=1 Tax=Trapa incisa TaxID=236973 RepID=A0AAN7L2G5_9MYRT|nr:hypothetical protein SAY87_017109 [Trapa incisa]